jgi:hypothetical protein
MTDVHDEKKSSDTRGWRAEFRERLLSVATMDRPLRVATAATVVGLVVAAAAIAARSVNAPPVSLGTIGGVQMTLGAPLFVVALVLLSLGCGHVLSGAVLARPVVAAIGILSLTFLIGWATGVTGIGGFNTVLPAWAQWFTRGLLVAILVGAVAVILLRRGRHGDAVEDRGLRLVILGVGCVLFGAYFFVLWIASPVLNGLTLFPQTVTLLMANVALVATPLLMIAAIDFGELGEFGATRLERIRIPRNRELDTGRRGNITAIVACAVAVVFGFIILGGSAGDRLWAFAEALILLLVALAIMLFIGRALRLSRFRWPKALSFAALFSVCAIITWVIAPSVAATVGAFAAPPTPSVTARGDYTAAANVHSESGMTGFTALVPVGWSVVPDKVNRVDRINNLFPSGLKVVLLGLVVPPGTTMGALEAAVHATQRGVTSTDHGWIKASVSPPSGGGGAIWMRAESGGQVRVFYGVADGPSATTGLEQLEAIVRTVRTAQQPPASLASVLAKNGGLATVDRAAHHRDDIIQTVAIGFELAIAIVAIVLFVAFGRRWSSTWRTTVLFFGAIAIITLIASVSAIGRVLFGPGTTWPVLTIGGLVAAAGVVGLAVVWVASRSRAPWTDRMLSALPGMIGSILALAAINELYDVALGAASVPAWAAILILVAVGWDILASGGTMTNLSSRTFPRSTRVLAYFGYILVLAAAMVFYSGQLSSATGQPVTDAYFEPESTTQSALFRVALPLLLILSLLRTVSSNSSNEEEGVDEGRETDTDTAVARSERGQASRMARAARSA